jgi:hypothetical protein
MTDPITPPLFELHDRRAFLARASAYWWQRDASQTQESVIGYRFMVISSGSSAR